VNRQGCGDVSIANHQEAGNGEYDQEYQYEDRQDPGTVFGNELKEARQECFWVPRQIVLTVSSFHKLKAKYLSMQDDNYSFFRSGVPA
jgi:hypothetical protein